MGLEDSAHHSDSRRPIFTWGSSPLARKNRSEFRSTLPRPLAQDWRRTKSRQTHSQSKSPSIVRNKMNQQGISRDAPVTSIWVLGAAAMIAGSVGGVVMDRTRAIFYDAPATYANPTPAETAQYNRARSSALARTAAARSAIVVGLMGVVLSAAFSFRASTHRLMLGTVVGAVAAGAFAAMGGVLALKYTAMLSTARSGPGLGFPLIMQSTVWLPLCAALVLCEVCVWGRRRITVALTCGVISVTGASLLVPLASFGLFLVTQRNSRDTIPPDSLDHCLSMGVVGSAVIAACHWYSWRQAPVAIGSDNAGG